MVHQTPKKMEKSLLAFLARDRLSVEATHEFRKNPVHSDPPGVRQTLTVSQERLSLHRHGSQSSWKHLTTAQSRAHGFCRASLMPRMQPPSCEFLRPDVKLGIFRGAFHPSRHPIHHMKALSWTVTEEERKKSRKSPLQY